VDVHKIPIAVADSRHRRMLEHYSHIRIDAKRQALDALDAARRAPGTNGDGNGFAAEADT